MNGTNFPPSIIREISKMSIGEGQKKTHDDEALKNSQQVQHQNKELQTDLWLPKNSIFRPPRKSYGPGPPVGREGERSFVREGGGEEEWGVQK